MVLVDSTAPHWGTAPDDNGSSYNAMGRVSAMFSASVRLGLGRLVGQFSYDGLPPRARDEARASMATESQASSTVDEYAEANTSMSEAGSLTDFGAKPLVVLTAGLEQDGQWMAAQDRMARLSSNSLHRVVAGATHAALIEDEKAAGAVSRAIRDVVASVRTSRPLH
jgi:hypothetical protein